MVELKGVSISKGISIGRAYLIEPVSIGFQIEKIHPEEIKKETQIFLSAVEKTEEDIEKIYSSSKGSVRELKVFFLNIIKDNTIITRIVNSIANEKISAKSAIFKTMDIIENQFKTLPNFPQEKMQDIISVFYRLIKNVEEVKSGLKTNRKTELEDEEKIEDHILVGVEIDPTQLLEILQTKNIKGIVLEKGGSASHASVIAHQHGIPAIFAVKDLMKNTREDDIILINANEGRIIVNPDSKTLSHFRIEKIKFETYREQLLDILDKPTKTIDNKKCYIMLNISEPYEVSDENTRYYDGVGLFRTEFIVLNKGRFLSEDEQVEIYTSVAEKFAGKPVIIRLLDIGGDKVFEKNLSESKPALGWRSIRILFSRKEELLKQIRAIIKSNVYKNLKILVPMVSSLEEVRKIRHYFTVALEQLHNENNKVNGDVPIGIMVEIPSVAVMIKEFLKESDFISIGTNDLTQYMLGVDRNNETIAEYYEPLNPSVLKLVHHCIHLANKMGKFVSVCGEIAGDPKYTRLLLGMGLSTFSMPQESAPFVKNIIVNTHSMELINLLQKVKEALTPKEVKKIIEEDYLEFQRRIGTPIMS